ncbi:TlpA disulfide reductase family protein [Sphingobacterium sp. HMA12]|uniref:TlpA disulfide reductase family protein n=1 Tax=Sphingobacterium sp. HMA12 TaxID=2050894 RepID=UPI000CE9C8A9|nr:TlpA disulfide reductase family protein [Sphingobacterium sp. HMA12]
MKTPILCLLLLFPILGIAQDQYSITGKVEQLKDGSKLFLVYNSDGVSYVDSTETKAGHFAFKGRLSYPVYSALYLNKNPYATKLQPREKLDYFRFYLEAAEIAVNAKDSLKNIVLSGSKLNLENEEFQRMKKGVDEKFDALNKEFSKLPIEQQKDSVLFAQFVTREKLLMDENYSLHLRFAQEHPDSYLSVIGLSFVASQEKFATAVESAFDGLSQRLKDSPQGRIIPLQLASLSKTKIGELAPDLTLKSPDGKTIKISDFFGKYLLIDFWASWCGPCRTENPNLVEAYKKFQDAGLEILGISLDDAARKEAWIKAITEDRLLWPQVSDLGGWDSVAAKLYGINSIPANFLLGPDGKIIARNLRGEDLQNKLKTIFTAQATQ